jgi:hypothetical protein
MRTNPEPQDRTGLSLDAYSAVITAHADGDDWLARERTLEMQTWMSRIQLK